MKDFYFILFLTFHKFVSCALNFPNLARFKNFIDGVKLRYPLISMQLSNQRQNCYITGAIRRVYCKENDSTVTNPSRQGPSLTMSLYGTQHNEVPMLDESPRCCCKTNKIIKILKSSTGFHFRHPTNQMFKSSFRKYCRD